MFESIDTRLEKLTYRPMAFCNRLNSEVVVNLWRFLRQQTIAERLVSASNQKLPVVELIAETWERHFGNDDSKDLLKRLTGMMLRQIMEQLGYTYQKSKESKSGIFQASAWYSIK